MAHMGMARAWVLGVLVLTGGLLLWAGCESKEVDLMIPALPEVSSESRQDRPVVMLEPVFRKLKTVRPVDLIFLPGGKEALVVELGGRVLRFSLASRGADATTWMDLSSAVSRKNDEEGLLGLALHPEFSTNGQVFAYYSATGPRRTVLARFKVSADGTGAVDLTSKKVFFEVAQPYGNHNGGGLEFGLDGYLYLGVGDGGAGGDPHGHGQNPHSWLGSILRIDVDSTSETRPYGIPPDNPFSDAIGGAPEVFAYGFRNPWRLSFDSVTGTLWVGDIGTNRTEEVNLVKAGGNYGWRVMEGMNCYHPNTCNPDGFELPFASYGQAEGGRITGGVVYRGREIFGLHGYYIYGDFVSGRIWAFPTDGPRPAKPSELLQTGLRMVNFSLGPEGWIFVVGLNGEIARLGPS